MVDIGTSDKITNLWPTPASRPIEKSGHKIKSTKDQSHQKKKKDKEQDEDEPGNNIDEYA